MRILSILALLAAIICGVAASADAYSCTSYRVGDRVYTNCN